jgi:hypothetical protein
VEEHRRFTLKRLVSRAVRDQKKADVDGVLWIDDVLVLSLGDGFEVSLTRNYGWSVISDGTHHWV